MSEMGLTALKVVFWVSFAGTVYTYFLYPLLLMALGQLIKRPRKGSHHHDTDVTHYEMPTVTMVVSAYNEEAVLGDKIANCRTLDYPTSKLKFLFGSDGSTDSTAEIMQAAADERMEVMVSQERRGKVGMVNQLMEQVDSKVVVFSDANTIYEPEAVRELVRPFDDPKVGCVIGKLELTMGHDNKVCRPEGLYWRYENRIKKLESALGIVPTVNGGIFAIRRELYQKLPEHAVTEDQVLGMTIMVRGFRCEFAEGARASETVSTWAGELRRRIRISAGNFQSLLLVPGIVNPRCGGVSFAFVSHKLLRWLVPLFLMVMLSANTLLAGEPFYGSTLLVQGLFYLSGVTAALVPKLTGVLKIIAIPRYFLAMNLAILMGLGRFLSKRQRAAWEKAPRQ